MKKTHCIALTALFAVLSVVGCAQLTDRVETAASSGTVTLSVGIDGTAFRSALPDIAVTDLSDITLSYQETDASGGVLTTLTEIGSWDSAAEMAEATILFKTGTYTFTLTAYCDDIMFSQTKSVTIVDGTNTLRFTPKMESFDNSEPFGKGTLSVSIRYDNDGIALVTACLYTLEGDRVPGYAEEALTIASGGNSIYEKTSVPSGNYILLFKFYADSEKTLLRGTYREYCSIVHKRTSSSECVLSNMGSLFTITYSLNGGAFASGITAAGNYTRQSAAITLPANTASATVIAKTGCTFGGWYESADFSGEAVTEIVAGSTGDKTFYAKWLSNAIITFNTNATSASITTSTQTVVQGAETALTTAAALGLSNTKGRFLGWATAADAEQAEYSDGGAICVTDATLTLFAIWSVATINPQSAGDTTDTDGDGLTDWQEIKIYYTDPSNKDTDGDGWTDGAEVNGMYNESYNSFNPLIADTPQLEIYMTAKPSIAYKYTVSESKSDTVSVSENDGYTSSSSTSSSNTKTHNETHGWSQTVGVSVSHTWSPSGNPTDLYRNTTTVSAQSGYNGSVSSGDSYTYSSSASESWSKSWTNGKSTATSNGRNVSGGVVRIPVRFKNPSYIAYTVNNVTVALYRIPNNAGDARVFIKNLTLSSDKVFTIPPLSESGDFELTADLGIAQTEELLKWSCGFEIEVSGFNISLQKEGQGANDFTDALTEVKAKTAAIYIDWGNTSGRSARTFNVSVKNIYNSSAQSIDDLYTKPTLDYIFQTILHYTKGTDYALNANGCLDTFFSVQNTASISNGTYTDGAWFILHKYTSNGERYQTMYAPYTAQVTGGWSFENIEVSAGDEIYIFYSVDEDGDGVPLNEELIYGTSDSNADYDDDELTDYDEIYGWYKSGIGLESKYSDSYKVYSSPLLSDTDGDDLLDYSTNSDTRDNDPLVPKLKNDTRLGTCRYAAQSTPPYTTFSFDSNDYCELSDLNETLYLNVTPKVSYATVQYKVGTTGTYQSLDGITEIPLSVGENYIYVLCTAPDEVTTQEYTLKVTSDFRTMKKFKTRTEQYTGGNVTFTWDSYVDKRAAASDGGYILYGKKGGTLAKTLTLSDVAQATNVTSALKSKDEFFLLLDSETLDEKCSLALTDLAPNKKYSFYLFAYAHKTTEATFKSVCLASATLTTPVTKEAVLQFYAHYVYDWEDQDGGSDPEYYWSFNGGKMDLSSLNIGSGSRKEFDDDDDKTYCFGKGEIHKYNHDPSKFSGCTKVIETTFDRTQDISFIASWEATEYDSGSSDDYLGKVTAKFTYSKASDSWTCTWSSSCGASGSSTIKAGERSGKQGGGYWNGNRWELHNSSEGEIDFHWDWAWDYE